MHQIFKAIAQLIVVLAFERGMMDYPTMGVARKCPISCFFSGRKHVLAPTESENIYGGSSRIRIDGSTRQTVARVNFKVRWRLTDIFIGMGRRSHSFKKGVFNVIHLIHSRDSRSQQQRGVGHVYTQHHRAFQVFHIILFFFCFMSFVKYFVIICYFQLKALLYLNNNKK